VFIVHVKQRADDDTIGQGLTAKINLVDLAGSERQNMAGTDGQTLREGAYINKRYFILAAQMVFNHFLKIKFTVLHHENIMEDF